MDLYNKLVEALVATADDWSDPGYFRRQHAVDESLELSNRFTAEAIHFAINQQMALLTKSGIGNWIPKYAEAPSRNIGVLSAGNVPLAGLQDFLAVILHGFQFTGVVSGRASSLLTSFAEDLQNRHSGTRIRFTNLDDALSSIDSLIATGSDETVAWIEQSAADAGVSDVLLRGSGFGVGVMDGRENSEQLLGFAEDALLHEGLGCRNVAIVWAPAGHSPDAFLEALAVFRGTFPAHQATCGTLKMPQAYLKAVDTPHAFGENMEFLISRGLPEVQQPCHIRWSEYDSLGEVEQWIDVHRQAIQVVVASDGPGRALQEAIECQKPGTAQRPELGWRPVGIDIREFLMRLGTQFSTSESK